MKHQLIVGLMTGALTFVRGGIAYAYELHADEVIEHGAQGVAHGQDGHAEQVVKHSEEALTHMKTAR